MKTSMAIKFKAARKCAGYTQQEIADLTGRSRATISKFENGKEESAWLVCLYMSLFFLDNPKNFNAADMICEISEDFVSEHPSLDVEDVKSKYFGMYGYVTDMYKSTGKNRSR